MATITILGKVYKTAPIPYGLQVKLNATFKRRVNAVEIVDKQLISSHIIGNYVNNREMQKARYYVIDVVSTMIAQLLERKLGGVDATVHEILKTLNTNGVKTYLKGGMVRDIFTGSNPVDVDAIFDSNINRVKDICDEHGWLVSDMVYRHQAMNIGGAKGISIEMANLKHTFMASVTEHEFTINDLVFDHRANVLIDVSGFGIFDVCNKIIRISPPPGLFKKWATDDWKKPLRYFKLLVKGFTPMTPQLHTFVIKYIETNLDTIYLGHLYETVPRIKHYIIKNLTNGTIDPDGTYEYGVNKRAIMPYLREMKKHLKTEFFGKIVRMLREDSHDKYLTRIATQISKPRGQSHNHTLKLPRVATS